MLKSLLRRYATYVKKIFLNDRRKQIKRTFSCECIPGCLSFHVTSDHAFIYVYIRVCVWVCDIYLCRACIPSFLCYLIGLLKFLFRAGVIFFYIVQSCYLTCAQPHTCYFSFAFHIRTDRDNRGIQSHNGV